MDTLWLTQFPVSPQTLQLLADAGWTPNRQLDEARLKRHLRDLEAHGFFISPRIVETIRCFGGLQLYYSLYSQAPNPSEIGTIDILIEPTQALKHYADSIEDYEAFLGERLCEIGSFDKGHFAILVNEQGAVYTGIDDDYAYMGESLLEAIDRLVLNKVRVRPMY